MTTETAPTASPNAPSADAGYQASKGAIWLLTLVYAFNMLDRQIVTILAEPMKRDLALADWQIGAMSGLAFALLYTTAGIPLARIADRSNRSHMIAASIAVWSGFTMLCGAARGFGDIMAARIGVGIGEAGCTPAAHSYISQYVPRERRASALATYSLGTPLGALAALAIGGTLVGMIGWRYVFVAAGLPGIILAVIVLLKLRDPRPAVIASTADPLAGSFRSVMKVLATKRAFWCVSFASGSAAFFYFGQAAFLGSLYLRTHAPALGELAAAAGLAPASLLGLVLGVQVGICGLIGTVAGGWLADRGLRFGVITYSRLPVITLIGSTPFFAGAVLTDHLILSFVLLGIGFIIYSMTYASTYAAIQTLAPARMRAMASAIQLFITNAIGLAFGPLFVGIVSDALLASLGVNGALRMAMAIATIPILIAAFLFWLAGRTIVADEAG